MNPLVTGGLLGLLLLTGGLGPGTLPPTTGPPLVVGGLTSLLLVTAGLGAGSGPLLDHADPRQGTILGVDTDPAGVDPRQGTIIQ
jgi:hypothetical protein